VESEWWLHFTAWRVCTQGSPAEAGLRYSRLVLWYSAWRVVLWICLPNHGRSLLQKHNDPITRATSRARLLSTRAAISRASESRPMAGRTLTFYYIDGFTRLLLVVEGGSASERRLDFHLADALRRCAFPHPPKPTTDCNSTLGSWPSHCCSPSARLSFACL
jgi:hypothetical protein